MSAADFVSAQARNRYFAGIAVVVVIVFTAIKFL